MKTVALFLSIALLSATRLFSQKEKYEEKYNVVPHYDVFINQVPMASKKAVVIKRFGKPDKIKKVISMDEYWFDYHYKRSTLQIDPVGDFMGFNIVDTSFIITYKSTQIRIGDSSNILKKLFPKSYKEYTTTKDDLRLRFEDNDSYIIFTIKNGIITQVHTWEDNS